jgi:hypothetical protein
MVLEGMVKTEEGKVQRGEQRILTAKETGEYR